MRKQVSGPRVEKETRWMEEGEGERHRGGERVTKETKRAKTPAATVAGLEGERRRSADTGRREVEGAGRIAAAVEERRRSTRSDQAESYAGGRRRDNRRKVAATEAEREAHRL